MTGGVSQTPIFGLVLLTSQVHGLEGIAGSWLKRTVRKLGGDKDC